MLAIIRCKIFVFHYAVQKHTYSDMHNYNVVVLYGCETWSLKLREEDWLRVFEIFLMLYVWNLPCVRKLLPYACLLHFNP